MGTTQQEQPPEEPVVADATPPVPGADPVTGTAGVDVASLGPAPVTDVTPAVAPAPAAPAALPETGTTTAIPVLALAVVSTGVLMCRVARRAIHHTVR